MSKIKLGDMVRERITGFQGVASARTSYLYGDDTIRIQPISDEVGLLIEYASFEECSVEKITEKKSVTGYLNG